MPYSQHFTHTTIKDSLSFPSDSYYTRYSKASTMLSQNSAAVGLLSLLLNVVSAQAYNETQITGIKQASKALSLTHPSINFPKCDALISANLSHIVHFPSSSSYPSLVQGSWTKNTQRSPFCFAVPNTATEVSQIVLALQSAGRGAGNSHIAIRSGGHGSDSQNSITDGIILDLTHLNATTYDATTKVASIGTGARWGNVYSDVQKHGVSVTGGRQSVVGVGGLTLGGGVGWTTPRTGFACDNVVNFEVVLASGEVVNANAFHHADLWRALKGGSSNFGIVTRFDIDTFPANNITLERRTTGPEHTDQFIDAIVDFADLDQSFHENAMVWVISYSAGDGLTMTATQVNTINNASTTAFDKFKNIPLLATTGEKSYTLPDAAAIDAPELDKSKEVM
jgi:hypothetical protein